MTSSYFHNKLETQKYIWEALCRRSEKHLPEAYMEKVKQILQYKWSQARLVHQTGRPCAACQAGKQVGSSHHAKNVMTTSRPLELLHMDLFGPVAYLSIGGSKYGLVIVLRDDWIQDRRHHWGSSHEDSDNLLWLPSPRDGHAPLGTLPYWEEGWPHVV